MSMTAEQLEQLLNQEVEYDPQVEDPFALPAPPPDGRHQAIISLGRATQGDDPIQIKLQRKDGETAETASGDPYLFVPVALKILAPGEEWDGLMVYDNVSSLKMRNGTTRLHEMLKACGNPPPRQCKLSVLRDMINQTLGGANVTVEIETQWKAQVKETDAKGKEEYKTLKTGMKNFPKLENGSYDPKISHPKTQEEVVAKAEVKGYYPIG